MQSVIVTIDDKGEVKVEAQGVVGQGCQALTRAIESALGNTTADLKKPEFNQQIVNRQQAGQR